MAGRRTATADPFEGLLERDEQIGALRSALDVARAGAGRTVAIRGPAGIGKTRLIEAAATVGAAGGFRVLIARATPFEQDFAFGVARQLLEPRPGVLEATTRQDAMTGAAALAARALGDGTAPSTTQPTADASFAAIHGLYWTVANLADHQPLLLAVDDIHWADAASLRWIAYVSRRISGLKVALLFSVRRDDPRADGATLRELLDARAIDVLDVPPLTEPASSEVVRARLGPAIDDELCRACHEASGGNPLLLELISDAMEEDAPRSMDRMREVSAAAIAPYVAGRLADLPRACTDLAEAAAVLGSGAPLSDAAAVAGVDLLTAADAADSLVRAELVRPGLDVTFVHPLLRDAIDAELGEHRRAALHATAAQVLRTRGVPLERVAAHLLAAAPSGDTEAAESLVLAGQEARARGDPELAIRFLRRALDEAPAFDGRAAAILELGLQEAALMDPAAEAHLREAVDASTTPRDRATAAASLGLLLMMLRRGDEAMVVIRRVLAEVEVVDQEASLSLLTLLTNVGLFVIAKHRELSPEAQQLRSMNLQGKTTTERRALGVVAMGAALDGEPVAVVADLARRGLAGPPEDIHADDHGVQCALLALLAAGEYREVSDRAAPLLEDALRRGSPWGAQTAWGLRSSGRLHAGMLRDAEADARTALELGREHGSTSREPVLLATLIPALVDEDRLDDAEIELTLARLPQNWEEAWPALALHLAVARLRHAERRTAEALTELQACADLAEQWGARGLFNIPWRSELALALGSTDDGYRLADEEVELATAAGAPGPIGIAIRARALLAHGDDRLRLLTEAMETLRGSQAVLEHARTLVELGAELRRTNRRAEAREPLRLGIDMAHRCGAAAVVKRGQAELHATGARPRRLLLTGLDAFTASERRVAELAADGLSNRDIAQALFVTTKTVETHLHHIYMKLGIASRGELATALGRNEGVPTAFGREPTRVEALSDPRRRLPS